MTIIISGPAKNERLWCPPEPACQIHALACHGLQARAQTSNALLPLLIDGLCHVAALALVVLPIALLAVKADVLAILFLGVLECLGDSFFRGWLP